MEGAMAQIIISLDKLTALQKIARALLVVTGLRNNPNVPGGDILADELEASAQNVQDAVTATKSAKDDWMAAVLVQGNMEKALANKYASTGTEVQRLTGGDEVKIDTTKFETRKTPGASKAMPKIEHFTVSMGDDAGEFDLHWDSVEGAQSYALQQFVGETVPAATQWQNGPPLGRRSAVELKGYSSGARVFFRVAAMGALGLGPWSEPVFKTAP